MDSMVADFAFGLVSFYPALTLALAVPYLAWTFMGARWLDTRWAPSWLKGARLALVALLFLLGITAPFGVATWLGIGPTDASPEAWRPANPRAIPMALLPFFAGLLAAAAFPRALSRYAGMIDGLAARIAPSEDSDASSHAASSDDPTRFRRTLDALLAPPRHRDGDAMNIARMPGYPTLTAEQKHDLYRAFCEARFLIVLKGAPRRGQPLTLRRLYRIPTRQMVVVAEEAASLDGHFARMPYASLRGDALLALLDERHSIVIRQPGLILHLDMATVAALRGARA